MSSFETQRRLTVVNACANAAAFTGGWEEPTAQIPSPLLAIWAAKQHRTMATSSSAAAAGDS